MTERRASDLIRVEHPTLTERAARGKAARAAARVLSRRGLRDGFGSRAGAADWLGRAALGDAHLSNFGIYAAPDRRLVFSLNDFDETLPGPFEWDVKRLVASFAVAGRERPRSCKKCLREQTE